MGYCSRCQVTLPLDLRTAGSVHSGAKRCQWPRHRKAVPLEGIGDILSADEWIGAVGVWVDQQLLKEKVAEAAFERVAAEHSDASFCSALGRARQQSVLFACYRNSSPASRPLWPARSVQRHCYWNWAYRLLISTVSAPSTCISTAPTRPIPSLHLIKGGGAALTREKIVAAASRQFICIADVSKRVAVLGAFPLPVEVIPMARSHVARELHALGGQPVWREGVVTDNHNLILDVHGMAIEDALEMEARINQITGVVCNGLFAARPADILFLGAPSGVEIVLPPSQ